MQNTFVGWRENQGNGNFTTFHNVYASLQRPDKIALGNLNTDNHIDIVQYKKEYDQLAKKMNTGESFGTTTVLDNSATQAYYQIHFLIDDVDNDGDNDILFFYSSGNSKSIIWYKNRDGNGDFAPRATLANLGNFNVTSNLETIEFAFSDIDGDQLKDLILLNSSNDKIWWKKNLGNLQFGNDVIIDQNSGRKVRNFTMNDVDEDGNIDLILTSALDDRIAIYYNNGNGAFSNPNEVSKLAYGNKKIIIEDVDQDNLKDILVAGYSDGKISWFKNVNGAFTEQQKIIKPSLRALSDFMYIDLDGDGDKDILFGFNDYSTYIQWFENLGNGDFNLTEKSITTIASTTLVSLASGDFDNDGDMDVFFQTSNQPIRVLLNNGSGIFTDSNQTLTGNLVSGLNPMIDLDADGINDIYLGTNWYKRINGTFQLQTSITTEVDLRGKHVVDFDNDGDLDIVYYKTALNEVGWLENVGNMQFNKHIISLTNSPFDAYPIDVNQDGYLDIVWGNRTSLVWQQNDGNQVFSEPMIIEENLGWTSSISAADLDGNNIPDIIYSTSAYANSGNRNDHISVYNISPRLSTTEVSTEEIVKIYPNPVTDMLYIQTKTKVDLIEIYNIDGKKINQTKESYINTTSYSPGIYIIKILTHDNQLHSYKFIKK